MQKHYKNMLKGYLYQYWQTITYLMESFYLMMGATVEGSADAAADFP